MRNLLFSSESLLWVGLLSWNLTSRRSRAGTISEMELYLLPSVPTTVTPETLGSAQETGSVGNPAQVRTRNWNGLVSKPSATQTKLRKSFLSPKFIFPAFWNQLKKNNCFELGEDNCTCGFLWAM